MKKPVLVAAVAALMLASAGAGAAVAADEPAPAYGGCISKTSGYLRILERGNLPKSVWGKCKSTEVKITFYSRSGAPKG
ncbi:hypothetical protein AB0K18_42695 [Nonomuraea sp. NPDC049421]|uniref:hypothetical protein n=1 Tax=Nonomuraea sp. NPDC049421 TaxID=3155275 RepID=UPI00344757A9